MNKCHCHPEFMGVSCSEEVPTTTTIATPGSTMTYERHETPYGMFKNKILRKKTKRLKWVAKTHFKLCQI